MSLNIFFHILLTVVTSMYELDPHPNKYLYIIVYTSMVCKPYTVEYVFLTQRVLLYEDTVGPTIYPSTLDKHLYLILTTSTSVMITYILWPFNMACANVYCTFSMCLINNISEIA